MSRGVENESLLLKKELYCFGLRQAIPDRSPVRVCLVVHQWITCHILKKWILPENAV